MYQKKRVFYTLPVNFVAKDETGLTVQRGVIPTLAEMWEHGSELLAQRTQIKRIIFYDAHFTYINGLCKPGYLPHTDEVLEEEDRQALLLLRSL